MTGDEHVLLIDKNLRSVPEKILHENVKIINLHCNKISVISGLQNLTHLKSLDLSANQIDTISGLSNLPSLTSLNLSSNQLTTVEGLTFLSQLKYINLSYNCISSLSGFIELHGVDSNLQVTLLHGNCLSDLKHVVSCLQGLVNLRHLVLKQDLHGNPVTQITDYREISLRQLPQLSSLDYVDRHQQRVNVEDFTNFTDWELWDSDEVVSINDDEKNCTYNDVRMIETPLLDAALSARTFRVDKASQTGHSKPSDKKSEIKPESDSIEAKTSVNELSPSVSFSFQSSDSSDKKTKHNDVSPRKTLTAPSKQGSKPAAAKYLVKKRHGNIPVRKVSSKQGNAVTEKESYVNLLKDLESERERRWKAEEAARKLALLVRELQAKDCEGKSLQEAAASTTDRLKHALLTEKKNNDVMKINNDEMAKKILSLNEELVSVKEQKHTAVHNLQNALTNANAQISKLHAKHNEERNTANAKMQKLAANYECSRQKNNQLVAKVESLQALFISKESEKKKSSCELYTLANEDFRNALLLQNEKEEKRHQREVLQFEQQIKSLQCNYAKLECEFREALLIESERYRVVHEQCAAASEKERQLETLLTMACEKEEKCRLMMSEMTSIIKEQKVKVSELVKSKEELAKQSEKQLEFFQQEVEQNRKKLKHFEALKQENSLLSSKLSALQSVVDGLKEQRRLWGHELAEQGSALSKDRGRLEMKIESLKAEISSLRKNNERDLDSLRIKTKVVEDQTETIFKMKEALTSKDKEIRNKLDEQLVEQQRLHDAIEDLTKENAELQDENAKLVERKQQLKNELANLHQDYDVLQRNHEEQKSKWLEKGSLLNKLEQQVKTASVSNKKKQDELMEERDTAMQALQLMKKKNDDLFGSYQNELRSATALHEQELQRMMRDKEEEVGRWKMKVDNVELEMRELLRETDEKKKAMEIKMEKLKSLLGEI